MLTEMGSFLLEILYYVQILMHGYMYKDDYYHFSSPYYTKLDALEYCQHIMVLGWGKTMLQISGENCKMVSHMLSLTNKKQPPK